LHIKEKKFKSKDKLIGATLNEFCENNFENASLNRIIKNAGISKGTFYYHFKNKESLYLFLLKEGFDAKWTFINSYTTEHTVDFSKMDIFDKFLYQAKAGMLFASEYPKYYKLGNMFLKEKGNPIYKKAIEHLRNDSSEILTHMIDAAYENNELHTSYSKEFINKLLIHLFSYYDDIFTDSTNDLDKSLANLENYVRFIKYGLKN